MKFLVRAMLSTAILALCGMEAFAQKDFLQLTDFKCDITIQDQHSVAVAALIRVAGDAGARPIVITVVRYASQEITGLSVMDSQRNPVPAQTALLGGALVMRIPTTDPQFRIGSALAFAIEYKIEDSSGAIVRIPLPVPDSRVAFGERPIQLGVALPPGQVSVGDTFPALSWQDAMHGSANLANVSSLAMVHWKPAGSINLADKITTPAILTDAGMVTLILTGSLLWWFKSGRKIERRRSAG